MRKSPITPKSPNPYKPARKVIPSDELTKQPFLAIKKAPRKNDVLFIKSKDPISIPPVSIEKDDDIIINKNIRQILCDIEMFNWQSLNEKKHNDVLVRIKKRTIYSIYIKRLCKDFGNDLNLFTDGYVDTIDDEKSQIKQLIDNKLDEIIETNEYESELVKNSMLNTILTDILYTAKAYENPAVDTIIQKILSEKKNNNLPYKFYYSPSTYIDVKRSYMYKPDEKPFLPFSTFLFSNTILNNNKRYSIIMHESSSLDIGGSGHFCFIFVDHEKKLVEYYDPYGNIVKTKNVVEIFTYLSELFKDYHIDEFWKNAGIQKVENIERDEPGFCVIWGCMMIHSKLLNIDILIRDLELSLIKHCEENSLSLYEVMLNYAYTMERIIPRDPKKYVLFEKSL